MATLTPPPQPNIICTMRLEKALTAWSIGPLMRTMNQWPLNCWSNRPVSMEKRFSISISRTRNTTKISITPGTCTWPKMASQLWSWSCWMVWIWWRSSIRKFHWLTKARDLSCWTSSKRWSFFVNRTWFIALQMWKHLRHHRWNSQVDRLWPVFNSCQTPGQGYDQRHPSLQHLSTLDW